MTNYIFYDSCNMSRNYEVETRILCTSLQGRTERTDKSRSVPGLRHLVLRLALPFQKKCGRACKRLSIRIIAVRKIPPIHCELTLLAPGPAEKGPYFLASWIHIHPVTSPPMSSSGTSLLHHHLEFTKRLLSGTHFYA